MGGEGGNGARACDHDRASVVAERLGREARVPVAALRAILNLRRQVASYFAVSAAARQESTHDVS
eukprot:4542003-Pleurochrysis_carterae.AAC.1